jgi:hypothetical protein
MPMIRITGEGGELVYEGEGELVMDQGVLGRRVALRQEQRLGGEVRGRELDLTEFLQAVPPSWSVHRRSTPMPVFDFSLDPPSMSIGIPELVTELRVDFPAGSLGWLRRVLEEPMETPEERSARHEQRAERLRTQIMPLDFGPVEPAIQEAVRSFDALRAALQTEGERRAHQALIARTMGIPQRTLYSEDELRDVLDMTVVRSAEHDRIIAETEAEFPHDPLGYGRVYPGDAGTSRWTPPADPNEKIRSCP